MKKHLLTVSAFIFLQQVSPAQTSAFLDDNAISAKINSNGDLFRDITKKGFEFPTGSGNSTFFNASFVIGAKNSMGTVYSAMQGDFLPGPLQDGSATASTHSSAWDRVWKISLDEINDHLAHYTDAGYVPIPAIAQWPAHGNAAYNEPANIAPFVDANGNGLYEPLLGDYPRIRGTQAIFFVQNDQAPGPTPGISMGIEIQCMAYVFNCGGNAALDHTVFANFKFVNKGTMTYEEAYVGLFADTDLGYSLDDYIGCNVSKGYAYAYNGDSYDEPNASQPGYGSNLPVQGIALLAGPWQDADGNDNPIETSYAAAIAANGIPYPALGMGYGDGIADNERLGMKHFMAYAGIGAPNANMSDPDNGDQMYNYLGGLWRDGSNVVWGGAGYAGLSGTSTQKVDYMYYSDTDPNSWASYGNDMPDDWREELHGNTPSDRRGIISAGPFGISPGEANELDIAFTVAIDNASTGDPLAALPTLHSRIHTVRGYFNNNLTPCGSFYSGIQETTPGSIFSLYPNPAQNSLNIQVVDEMTNNTYTFYNSTGKLVSSGTFNGHTAALDLSSLEEGIYFIRVNGAGATKFVVQR